MTHRQPQLPLARRIIAAGCVALWLAGVSACNLEALFCCPSHDSETAAHEDHEHSKDAVADTTYEHDANAHSQDAAGHPHDSNKHESKEGSACCSTLKAVVPTAKAIVFNKPAFHPIPLLCVLLETHATSLALSEIPPNRQAKPRERVFAQEVCNAPANRAHAPPAFI